MAKKFRKINNYEVTCIIISYNEIEYLSQAIESCISQINIDGKYEVIIGDDGSNDGSIDLIKRYASAYPDIIKYFVMDRDDNDTEIITSIRVSNVIKRGLSLAKGKYITLLSGDDWFCDKEKFYKQTQVLKNSSKKVNICNFKYVYDDSSEEIIIRSRNCSNNVLLNFDYMHISAFMFSKEVFGRGLLLERFCDDVGMVYSLDALGEFTYCSDVMFAYRQRTSSIMHTKSKLELCVIELLLSQDVLNAGLNGKSDIWMRFVGSIKEVYRNRNKLYNNKRYSEYTNNSKKYNNDVLNMLIEFDTKSLFVKIKWYVFFLFKNYKSKYLHHMYKKFKCDMFIQDRGCDL